ncbi:LuxR C-terminal-related transcriptional regulator [Piscinibacter sakaiensis]|uniref:LuxR C-terminal-related transcriptional regulator n=1 Tax=Piscinibacter sakaiensis TaxID=1547922 RepID=UPI003AB05970
MQMSTPTAVFALAKIQPPRLRQGLIERPALEQSLQRALQQNRLTLLIAPAGYGKTAALTRQIELLADDCALAWISADEDDQLQRFLGCLTMALQPFDLPWRVSPQALGTLALASGGVRAVADEIVNALALAQVRRGLIIVDDAHRITDPAIFELLQAVLARLPEPWGVAIASRNEPPLPSLARWRAGGELAEFRQFDLRFSENEVDALIDHVGGAAAGLSSQQLLQRTDGWAAGLRLSLTAAAADRRLPGAGIATQRHLFDYMASEVLDDMPADLRRFLLRCSVLPELTASRCAHVSQMPQAALLLDEVERRGLFVSVLDAAELTLRLHDLFRDFLEDRLQREYPDEWPQLLRRAADNEPDLVRAVSCLIRAGAWDEAGRLLEAQAQALLMRGAAPELEQMLAQFPAAEFEARPGLHLARGLAAFTSLDFDQLVVSMQAASAGFIGQGRDQAAALAQAYACIGLENTGRLDEALAGLAVLREREIDPADLAFVCFASAWGNYAQARTELVAGHVGAMLDALEQQRDPQVWDRCFFLSLMTGLPGMRAQLERFAHGAMRLTADRPSQLRAGAMHTKAWLAFSQADLDGAAQFLARADDDCRWLGRPRILMTENWMAHTIIDAIRGDRERSLEAAQQNRHDLEQKALPANRLSHEYEEIFTHIRACWILGEDAMLRERESALARLGNDYEWMAADDDRQFSRALVAILDGRLVDARDLLATLELDVERSCFYPATQARLTLAFVECRLGRIDAAAASLRPWLAAARAGGDIGGALLCGPAVLRALADADWRDRLDAADCRLLDRLAATFPPRRPHAMPASDASRPPVVRDDPLLATLSARELEVLERMAAGDSNKLIARRFDLSPHTVKRHVANILDKLDARSRGEAAARWRR